MNTFLGCRIRTLLGIDPTMNQELRILIKQWVRSTIMYRESRIVIFLKITIWMIKNQILEEKKLNNALSKVASPYFGDTEATEITVEEKHLKLVNPKRANVNALIKNRKP